MKARKGGGQPAVDVARQRESKAKEGGRRGGRGCRYRMCGSVEG